jgi:hypothetical protein
MNPQCFFFQFLYFGSVFIEGLEESEDTQIHGLSQMRGMSDEIG